MAETNQLNFVEIFGTIICTWVQFPPSPPYLAQKSDIFVGFLFCQIWWRWNKCWVALVLGIEKHSYIFVL